MGLLDPDNRESQRPAPGRGIEIENYDSRPAAQAAMAVLEGIFQDFVYHGVIQSVPRLLRVHDQV